MRFHPLRTRRGKDGAPSLFKTKVLIQQGGRADVGVAMNLPVAQEARVFQAGNQAQHARLLAELEMVLEADQVVAVGAQVLLAQLHHGPGRLAGARIAQAHRLHGAEAQRVAAAAGQHLDGQAAFEIVQLLPLLCSRRPRRRAAHRESGRTRRGPWGS